MKNYVKLGMGLIGIFGIVPAAQAVDNKMEMNKYAEYRQDVESSMGVSDAGTPEVWQHSNKYAAEQATNRDLGGTVFPGITEHQEDVPKNFKNNVVY